MVLNVIARPGDPVAAMRRLLTDNHDDERTQRAHVRRAIAHLPRAARRRRRRAARRARAPTAARIRLTVDLPPNFALNQPLSPFALAALELLDREAPTYALDVVSVIESTLDDPRQVLSAQRYKARGEAVAAMKAEGIEYDERMELLDDVTYPQPLAELLDAAYEIYRRGHPWVADYELRPKSVVRDMFERAMTFGEYVGFYELARSEGLVLRYLADAYRALRQTVPETPRAPRSSTTSSSGSASSCARSTRACSTSGSSCAPAPTTAEPDRRRCRTGPPRVTANDARLPRAGAQRAVPPGRARRAARLVRPRRARRRRRLGRRRAGARRSSPTSTSTTTSAPAPTPAARALLIIDEQPGHWRVRQILDDPAGDHDWGFTAEVDLAASDEVGRGGAHHHGRRAALTTGGAVPQQV